VMCNVVLTENTEGSGYNGPMSSREYTVGGHKKEVVCYWGTWANYRPGDGKFTPDDIDPSLCTNIIYSFAGLDSKNNSIKSLGTSSMFTLHQ
jgi:GH18 family chitinase